MEKNTTLNLRINPEVEHDAELVLSALGLSMTAAINIYLKQIALRGGIPFDISLPPAPPDLNVDFMTKEELHATIDSGLDDIKDGRTISSEDFFAELRKRHQHG